MIEFHTLDVFTTTPFTGNPLAVVLGADDLSPAQMQIIAREFNLSETIFVQKPQDPAHTARVRIFFPTAEIPFAGHPTIGCAILLAERMQEGDFTTTITLEEEAGLVPVTVTLQGSDITAELTAPVLPYPAGGAPDPALLAAALGLQPADLGPHRPNTHEGGPRFLYAPVRDLDALARARPIEPHWSQLMKAHGVDSTYLYAPASGECDYCARMFSPTAGIPEDPATGSATAILASQLIENNEINDGTTHLTLHQGIEMGRPSTLYLTVKAAHGRLTSVRIKGSAVRIGKGQLRLP